MSITCCVCGFADDKSILSHVRNEHGMSAKEYRKKFDNSPLRSSWLASNADAMDAFRAVGRANKQRRMGQPSGNKLKDGQWSKQHSACVLCGLVDSPHAGNGICKKCTAKAFSAKYVADKNVAIRDSGVEGEDYVTCLECGKPFQMLRTTGHLLSTHKMTLQEYMEKHPGAKITAEAVEHKRSLSVSKGRKKLFAERGYLNPQTQRDSKRREMIARISEGKFPTASKSEDAMAEWLKNEGYVVESYSAPSGEKHPEGSIVVYRQFPVLGRYSADFAIPSLKIIIEVLGTFWHGWDYVTGKKTFDELSEPAKKNVCSDRDRTLDMTSAGWKIVEAWEHDIKAGTFPDCLRAKNIGIVDAPHQRQETAERTGLVCAKDVAKGARRLHNFRWLARENGITVLPGLMVSERELEILRPLVDQFGDNRAVPADMIDDVLKQCRREGFPHYSLSDEDKTRKWLALRNCTIATKKNGLYIWDGFATELASVFHPHMFECRKRGKLSPIEVFSSDDLLSEDIYKILCLHGKATESTIRGICRSDSRGGVVSNFSPKVCMAILRHLFSDVTDLKVLDPCAGFGGRLLGFAAAGVSEYVGIDLSEKTFRGLERERDFLRTCGMTTNVRIIHGNCVAEMPVIFASGKQFDLIMTSPPFVDLEEYVGVPFYTEKRQWIDEFMTPFLQNSFKLLRPCGMLSLSLGKKEAGDNEVSNLVNGLAINAGFECMDPIPFLVGMNESNRRKKPLKSAYIQVWRRP